MGFEPGKGLGKNLQGRTKPIETTLRKGRGAIGFYGPEQGSIRNEPTQSAKNNFQYQAEGKIKNLPNTNLKPRNDLKHNSNNSSSSNTKPSEWSSKSSINVEKILNNVTKLAEINKSDQPSNSKLKNGEAFINIGAKSTEGKNFNKNKEPHTKLIEADTKLDEATSEKPRNFEKPIDTASSADAEDQDKCNVEFEDEEAAQFEQDPLDLLRSHLKNLKIGKQDKKLEKVTKCLEECRQACLDIPLVDALDVCSDLLKTLESYRNDGVLYKKITTEVTEIITDAVDEEFLYWDALDEAKEGARLMALTREVLLQMPRPIHEKGEVMAWEFNKIIWKIIVPKFKEGIDHWNASQPKEALTLFEWWEPIFTHDMISDIVDNHLHVKLESALFRWDPIGDAIPVESWVRPWIQILGNRTRTFYPIVVKKLADALVSLEAEEFDYGMLMKSGLSILDERSRLSFAVDHVVPKLARYLGGIRFTLDEQNFDQLKRVTDWAELVPMKILADCLVENFFPKMIRILSVWVKLVQVLKLSLWLAGWLNQIPNKIKSNPAVRRCIDDAMIMMEYGIAMSRKN